MRDAIKNINRQFAFQPKAENAGKLKKSKKFVVCGLGGSHIPADILKAANPALDLVVWNDYGLPPLKDLKERLVVVVSYSGNTEEALSSFAEAKRLKLRRAAIGTGGKLLLAAQKDRAPYVQIPNTGIQPRMGTGFMLRALMKIVGDNDGLRQTARLAKELDTLSPETEGKRLAKALDGAVPVVCASRANAALAWNWKIKLNETGKIPAFCNVFPELNHNEMTGFDSVPGNRALSRTFQFVFLEDPADDERIRTRMKITAGLYRDRGFRTLSVPLKDAAPYQKIFSALVLADWTAFHVAINYGAEAEKVPMVEDLKRMLKR